MKTYLIAELGINHNGKIENCFKMIDAAADAGCSAAKFQFFRAASLYPKSAGKLDWKGKNGRYSYDIYKAVKGFELSYAWLDRLIAYCKKNRLDFISSVFDAKGADILINKGMRKIKLSSYTITNIPLIEHCARKRLPIIMSTGGARLGEIEEAVSAVLKYHDNISLLHCNINYPTELKDCNLGVIGMLRLAFPGVTIGFSDHTIEISDAAVQSIYLGAELIEKHITLDKKMKGPDHFFALEPNELKRFVKDIKKAGENYIKGSFKIDKQICESTSKFPNPRELYMRNFAFMKLFAKKHVSKGKIIKPGDIAILRPGKKAHGLEPKYLDLFKKFKITAKRNIAAEDPITWSSIL